MSKEGKHHYIPAFYLTKWAGSDGMLCQYSRPRDRVILKRVHPDGTGYEHGLYSVPDYPVEQVQYIETVFLKKLDGHASKALNAMLADPANIDHLPIRMKVAWASYLYSLLMRAPENLAERQGVINAERTRREAAAANGEDVYVPPATLKSQELIPLMARSKLVIRGLIDMQWTAKSVSTATFRMLTSDRPYIMTNGIAQPEGHIVIPLSPTVVFFATRNDETFGQINSMSPDLIVTAVNSKVCEQAISFVYGVDDSQLRFVQNRLGRRVRASPLG
jgi:hypothetical protein